MRFLLLLLVLSLAGMGFVSCSTVKPYQRSYLNDDAMRIGTEPVERFDEHVHTYREGASGGGSEKGSGGCGCN